MISEDKLTVAERGVLAAFCVDGTGIDVEGAEIRGDFLRGLFLGEYGEKANCRGTRIFGANISSVLNMEFCETKFPVWFRNCHFARKIRLQQLACPELDLRGCTLEKGIDAKDAKIAGTVFLNDGFNAGGEVNFLRSRIGGQLDCTGGKFQSEGGDALRAQHIKVADNVFLRAEFNGAVDLVGADIEGQLNCRGGNFQNAGEIALNAQDIRVVANVFLDENFVAVGTVWLAGADIKRQFACAGGSFRNEDGYAINAQGIKVGEIAFLSDGFEAEGETSLLGAEIGGQLNCAGGSFQNEGGYALNAQNIKVAETVFLSDEFNAKGAVSLVGAEIGGQLNCRDGNFHNEGGDALNAHNVKVADAVFLHNEFKAEGAVNLLGAEIGGQLNCGGGSFHNEGKIALNAQSIKVTGDALITPQIHEKKGGMRDLSANGWVSFLNASIGGNFVLNSCKFTHLSLAGTNVLGEFQDDTDTYKLDKGDRIDLNIDGFRYQRLCDAKERSEDRLSWVGSMSKGDKFYPQPYEQLMKVYREMGHMNLARDVGFALEERRRKAMKSRWWKAWYWLLRHTIGYGYKPFRIVKRWFLPVIVGGSLFLGTPCTTWENPLAMFSGVVNPEKECRVLVSMLPSDAEVLLSENWKNHKDIPTGYPRFIPFFYAVEAALPVLPLGQTETWHPENPLIKFMQATITIVGALALAILASFGVGVLGPRWKNE